MPVQRVGLAPTNNTSILSSFRFNLMSLLHPIIAPRRQCKIFTTPLGAIDNEREMLISSADGWYW